MSKNEEVRQFIQQRVREALDSLISDRLIQGEAETAKAIGGVRQSISQRVACEVCSEYRFLELADIMEWKKTRTRR